MHHIKVLNQTQQLEEQEGKSDESIYPASQEKKETNMAWREYDEKQSQISNYVFI